MVIIIIAQVVWFVQEPCVIRFASNPQITQDVIKYNKGTHEIINAYLLRTMQRILYR